MTSRRTVLTGALTLGGLAVGAPAIAAQCPPLPVDRKAFNRYLELFTARDPAFTEFYTPDVVLRIEGAAPDESGTSKVPPDMHGREGILNFYRMLWTHVREQIEVKFFVADADRIAVELLGAFICTKDIDDPKQWGRPVKKGEVRRQQGMVLYELEKGKFKLIRAVSANQLHDWRMEAL